MKLLGRDINPETLLAYLEQKLEARGLAQPQQSQVTFEGLEPRVDPMAFVLEALAQHADPTRPLEPQTHREGLSGAAVLLAKRAFRTLGQAFLNEALARQSRFNGHVRDGYAQLSAQVVSLREEVDRLRAQATSQPPDAAHPNGEPPAAPPARRTAR